MKKESLLVSMPKLILVVVLIVCVGTVIGLMKYYLTKTSVKIEVPENKIIWVGYNSADKSLFDWENYNIKYPNNWNYAEERISSSRKTGTLTTVFIDSKRFNKLLIITGGKRLDSMANQNISEIKFSNNIFDKYTNVETGQVYYIYKTGTDEEINFGMETEMFFRFSDTDENIIKEILGSFSLNLPIEIKEEIANWQTYRNEEFGFEMKYPVYYSGRLVYDFGTMIKEDYDSIHFFRDMSEKELNDFKKHYIGTFEEGGTNSGTFFIKLYNNEEEIKKWYEIESFKNLEFKEFENVDYYIVNKLTQQSIVEHIVGYNYIIPHREIEGLFLVFEIPEFLKSKFEKDFLSSFKFIEK